MTELNPRSDKTTISTIARDIARVRPSSRASVGDESGHVGHDCFSTFDRDLTHDRPKSEILVDINESTESRIESTYRSSPESRDRMRDVLDGHTRIAPYASECWFLSRIFEGRRVRLTGRSRARTWYYLRCKYPQGLR